MAMALEKKPEEELPPDEASLLNRLFTPIVSPG